jgi:outer membrane immunogenic protein
LIRVKFSVTVKAWELDGVTSMKMYRIGLLAFTLTSVAALASANAADVYRAPEPFAGGYKDGPVYSNWAGFYIGAHVGGAWSELEVKDFDEVPGTFKNNTSGVFGGGTVGYNFQRGNFVFGPEIDLGGMDLSHTTAQPGTGGIINSKIDSGFYMDATARLGYSFGQTLVYAKGGYAFFDGPVTDIDKGEAFTRVTGLSGWTVGGGVEYKLNPAWSVKAEYQFFDFGTERLVLPSDGDRFDNDLTIHTVKAGVNYHFLPAYEPLK